jgi:hypothetical protein
VSDEPRKRRRSPCPLADCAGQRAPEELVCPRHWFQIPKALRDEVWRTYRRFGAFADPYHEAVTAAFASIGYDEDGFRKAAA